jgi:hypothetical protein
VRAENQNVYGHFFRLGLDVDLAGLASTAVLSEISQKRVDLAKACAINPMTTEPLLGDDFGIYKLLQMEGEGRVRHFRCTE